MVNKRKLSVIVHLHLYMNRGQINLFTLMLYTIPLVFLYLMWLCNLILCIPLFLLSLLLEVFYLLLLHRTDFLIPLRIRITAWQSFFNHILKRRGIFFDLYFVFLKPIFLIISPTFILLFLNKYFFLFDFRFQCYRFILMLLWVASRPSFFLLILTFTIWLFDLILFIFFLFVTF